MTTPTPFITGQLIMHNKGEKDGRTLFMVVGIIAVPQGQEWLDGHQYTVYSGRNDHVTIELTAPIDRRGERLGTADAMLTSPIWRI
jgi:hypothetical protein